MEAFIGPVLPVVAHALASPVDDVFEVATGALGDLYRAVGPDLAPASDAYVCGDVEGEGFFVALSLCLSFISLSPRLTVPSLAPYTPNPWNNQSDGHCPSSGVGPDSLPVCARSGHHGRWRRGLGH